MDQELINRLLDLAICIQQIPAPTFDEERRAAFVYQRFRAEGVQDVSRDASGNVLARLPGRGAAPPLVVSAHLDTVFPPATDLNAQRNGDRIYGPGIGDNAIGVAGLFALLWALQADSGGSPTSLPGDVWLVANTAEEGLGNLSGMRAVVDRFGDQALAYLVLEGMSIGQVYHRGLAVRRYEIHLRTRGGHSWVDYGAPSAVHELASLVHQLASLKLPSQARTTLNVGVISGGISVNTIASSATCLVDLRSENEETLRELTARMEDLLQAAHRPGVQVSARLVGQRPAGSMRRNHPLVRLAVECLQAQGIRPHLNIGSTDANLPLSRGLPAICLGLTSGGGAHTAEEYIDTPPLKMGLASLVAFVKSVHRL